MSPKGGLAARERAREAKIRRYAEQAEREQKVEDQVTEFYLASDKFDAAQEAAANARAQMAGLVQALITELKEPVSGVAVLCGITPAQVRALRKEATAAAPTPAAPPATTAARDERAGQAGTTVGSSPATQGSDKQDDPAAGGAPEEPGEKVAS